MIRVRPSDTRGRADFGWLRANYTFSFGGYRDPAWDGFEELRVLNEDRVDVGGVFSPHPHRDMEIVTYVLEGALRHEDSLGNGGTIRAGEVQRMTAGRGIVHSEANASDSEPLHLLQMWVFPTHRGTDPGWEQRAVVPGATPGRVAWIVQPGGGPEALDIGADARFGAAAPTAQDPVPVELGPGRAAWVQVTHGTVRLDDVELHAGDGAGVRDVDRFVLSSANELPNDSDSPLDRCVVWDLPQTDPSNR